MAKSTPRSGRILILLICVAGVVAWVALSPPGANDVVGGDEGYYGVMARNVLADPGSILSPSNSPLGPPGDKPPVYPALLAVSIAFLGPTEAALRIPSLLMAVFIAMATAVLVARAAGWRWGSVAAAFLVALPWFADASRSAWGEIPVTMFCLGGMIVASSNRFHTLGGLWAGALFGIGFLCKLWFAGLLMIPVLVLLLFRSRERAATLFALLAAAVVVGSLQLLGIAVFRPEELNHWWNVYVGTSLAARLAGEGFADYWVKSPWHYWFALTRAFVLLLPLVALGFEYTVRHLREPLSRMLFVWGALFLLLSIFQVKSGIYLYPIVPAWAALAAVGASTLVRGTWRIGPSTPIFFFLSFPLLGRFLGEPWSPLLPWLVSWATFFAVVSVARWSARGARLAALGLIVLAVAGGSFRILQRLPLRYHDPGYQEVASALAPFLEDSRPEAVSYLAPEKPAFGYYLFRNGDYWGTPITPWTDDRRRRMIADGHVRAFIVDPSRSFYGGWPDSTTVAWLEDSTREITREVESRAGRGIDVRVFVRDDG